MLFKLLILSYRNDVDDEETPIEGSGTFRRDPDSRESKYYNFCKIEAWQKDRKSEKAGWILLLKIEKTGLFKFSLILFVLQNICM